MLFLAHVQGDGIGFSAGGMAVINKSFFLTVWHQITLIYLGSLLWEFNAFKTRLKFS